jgi:hypothetical protein
LVTYPRIPVHEIAATVAEANPKMSSMATGSGRYGFSIYEL